MSTTLLESPVDRSTSVYLDAVGRHFQFLKGTDSYDQFILRGIALESGGKLAPLCQLHRDDEGIVAKLAEWRSQNQDAFPTQFQVTIEGTQRWLTQGVLDNPQRLTFLVLNRFGRPIGHMGLTNALNKERSVEIDNVVRGEKDCDPGLMSEALAALVKWTHDTLGPDEITLRVFKDNAHAVRFYSKLGFHASSEIPLSRSESGGTVRFEPTTDEADRTFLVMKYLDGRRSGEKMILTAGPSISAIEVSYANDAAKSGWNGEWSKYLSAFEQRFAEFVGCKYAIATSSCTGALHLSLLSLGIGPGDEVIVPDITWVATANAVLYAGATPVFCDVDPQNWCMDTADFESKITSQTKAVLPVHLYGHPAPMHLISEVAGKHGLAVIEDAAPSIGAECLGQRTGSFGDVACFSFQGAKLLVTGEGGMMVTNDDQVFERAKSLADQGRDPSRTFWIRELGWKYKMSNLQAALGLGQLERVEELVERKRRIFSWYEEELTGVPGIELARESDYARSIYWMSSILVLPEFGLSRDDLMRELKTLNVDTRPVFPAISQYPYWPNPQSPTPVAKRIGEQGINLPSGVLLSRNDIGYVCDQICKLGKSHGSVAA